MHAGSDTSVGAHKRPSPEEPAAPATAGGVTVQTPSTSSVDKPSFSAKQLAGPSWSSRMQMPQPGLQVEPQGQSLVSLHSWRQ